MRSNTQVAINGAKPGSISVRPRPARIRMDPRSRSGGSCGSLGAPFLPTCTGGTVFRDVGSVAGWVDEPTLVRAISADVDSQDGFALHFALARLRSLPTPGIVEGTERIWRTRHGWHLRADLHAPVRHDHADALRAYVGDDASRIEYDQRDRNRPQAVLFDVRRGVRKRREITEEVMNDYRTT